MTLTFTAPEGLTVTPAEVMMKQGEDEAKVAIAAAEDAPIGEVTIIVTGTPVTGEDATANMEVKVKDRD